MPLDYAHPLHGEHCDYSRKLVVLPLGPVLLGSAVLDAAEVLDLCAFPVDTHVPCD
jgi:hypothetical protein